MASVIAKCDGYNDIEGVIGDNQFTINFPPSYDDNGSTWNIYYKDDRDCPCATSYHVAPVPCSHTIHCNPTTEELTDGEAVTLVKVGASRSGCSRHFTVNGSGDYDGGGSGYSFTATSVGTYTFACVEDPSVTCTFDVIGACTYSISCNPTQAQLNDGTAKTVVTVTTSRSGCDTHFTINGSGSYDGGGSGYTFIATSARTYTFACVGDPSVQCTFVVSEAPQPCVVTSISCNPTSYTLSSTSDSAKTIVTVVSSGPCSKKWKATVDSREVTGNSGSQLVVTSPQTVTITSVEDTTKSCTFYVTSAETPDFETNIVIGVNSDYATRITYSSEFSDYCRPTSRTTEVQVAGNFNGIMDLSINIVGVTELGRTKTLYYVWDDQYWPPGQCVESVNGWTYQGSYTFNSGILEPPPPYYTTTINLKNGGKINVSFNYQT